MSKYIEMITKANKTLSAKCEVLTGENEMLRSDNETLKRKVYELEGKNNILERNKCNNQNFCKQFGSMMGMTSYILDKQLVKEHNNGHWDDSGD